jgi:hypothetical protein
VRLGGGAELGQQVALDAAGCGLDALGGGRRALALCKGPQCVHKPRSLHQAARIREDGGFATLSKLEIEFDELLRFGGTRASTVERFKALTYRTNSDGGMRSTNKKATNPPSQQTNQC